MKKNLAITMAVVTTATTVAPIFASEATKTLDGTTVSVSNTEKLQELKKEVEGYFNTKFTSKEKNLKNANNKGQSVYTISVEGNIDGQVVVKTTMATFRDLERELVKVKKNTDYLNITVEDKNHTTLNGEIVDYTSVKYGKQEDKTVVALPTTTDVTAGAIKIVKSEDGKTSEITMLNNDTPMYVKEGDVKLDLTKPVYKKDSHDNFLNKDGEVITDANTADRVVTGFEISKENLSASNKENDKTFTVRFGELTEVEMKASDLYEISSKRLTIKGNELRKYIIDYNNNAAADKKIVLGAAPTGLSLTINIPQDPADVFTKSSINTNYAQIVIKGSNAELVALYNLLNSTPVAGQTEVIAGTNRYATAVEVSKEMYNNADNTKAKAIVLVSANAKADGLAASPLAASLDAPILFTDVNSVNDTTMAEIERLNKEAGKKLPIYLIGGETVISAKLEDKLDLDGYSLTRLAGKNRFETSLEIAKSITTTSKDVFVAGGLAEADAMSIAAVASRDTDADATVNVTPIILTDKAKLSDAQSKWIDGKVNATIIGGETVVNDTIKAELEELTTGPVDRLAGARRQETNAKVVKKYMDTTSKVVYVAKSDNNGLVDALPAAVLASKDKAVVVLATNELESSQVSNLESVKGKKTIVQAGYGIASAVIEGLGKIFN